MTETTTTANVGGNENLSPAENQFSTSRHATAGAIIAVFLAALWVIQYLARDYAGLSLSAILMGQVSGIDAGGAEALFVVTSRFIIVFGLGWGPITAIIAAVRRARSNDHTVKT